MSMILESEGFEVMDGLSSSRAKAVIFPSNYKNGGRSKESGGKRRERRTSVTAKEMAFLKNFDASSPDAAMAMNKLRQEEDDIVMGLSSSEHRRSSAALHKSISARSLSRKFRRTSTTGSGLFEKLVANSNATDDDLDNSILVLNTDYAFSFDESESDRMSSEREMSSIGFGEGSDHFRRFNRSGRRSSQIELDLRKVMWTGGSIQEVPSSPASVRKPVFGTDGFGAGVDSNEKEEDNDLDRIQYFRYKRSRSLEPDDEVPGKNGEEVSDDDDDDDDFIYTILGTSATDPFCSPHLMSPQMLEALRPHLPFVVQEDNFWLRYSMARGDGSSLLCLWESIRSSSRTLIAVETPEGDVFGSFTSTLWEANAGAGSGYYGSGEAFLWRRRTRRSFMNGNDVDGEQKREMDVEVFPWTGRNRNVQHLVLPSSQERASNLASSPQLAVGGGGPDGDPAVNGRGGGGGGGGNRGDDGCGSGLVLLEFLDKGFTEECRYTFGSPRLVGGTGSTDDGIFEIENLEVWSLTPVDNIEEAEKLELGRRFIFSH